MMLLGLSGVVSTTDTPSTTTQGSCPNGYAEAYGVCVQVTSTAPADLVETDPSKLPPATRVPWGKLALMLALGAAGGVVLYNHKRR